MPRRRRPPRPGALTELAPLRILTQIVALQASYYAIALILIVFSTIVAGRHPDAGLLFDWHHLRGDVVTGWTLGLCWMLDSLITVIPIILLIARSKLVPDFALTLHMINLFATTLYTRSIPTNVYWWGLQIASVALMTGLGMWACQWRELQPMSFGGGGSSKGKGRAKDLEEGGAANGRLLGDHGDREGFAVGDGRGGRGRDGQGSYEMVEMAKEPA